MLKVTTILKSISQYNQNEATTTAFANWLSYTQDPDCLITPELIQSFFQDCLEYPHWQQNKRNLGLEIQRLLESICLQLDEVFDFAEITWPNQIQVIEIESLPDWVDAINGYLNAQYKTGGKFRLIHDEALQKIIAIVLQPNSKLVVREFSKKMFIRNGTLTPLREDLQLFFDANLELEADQIQKIETAPFMTAQFSINKSSGLDATFGAMARGYLFQKFQYLNGESLGNYSRIFYTVKRLEQHFLKRESDPFYQEIINAVEHGIRMLRLNDQIFTQTAPDLLAKAQNALDYVFTGDKLLTLLVRDLQHTMAGKHFSQPAQVKDTPTWSQTQANQNQMMTTIPTNQPNKPSTKSPLPLKVRGSDLTN